MASFLIWRRRLPACNAAKMAAPPGGDVSKECGLPARNAAKMAALLMSWGAVLLPPSQLLQQLFLAQNGDAQLFGLGAFCAGVGAGDHVVRLL